MRMPMIQVRSSANGRVAGGTAQIIEASRCIALTITQYLDFAILSNRLLIRACKIRLGLAGFRVIDETAGTKLPSLAKLPPCRM